MSARNVRHAVALSTALVAAAVGAAQAQLNSAQQDQVGQPREQQSQAPAYQTQQSQAPRDAAMLPPVVVTALANHPQGLDPRCDRPQAPRPHWVTQGGLGGQPAHHCH